MEYSDGLIKQKINFTICQKYECISVCSYFMRLAQFQLLEKNIQIKLVTQSISHFEY